LIVEFANQLQVKEGLDGARAARKAAALRFRPIQMTSIATILGASPIAFGGGAGAETRNPLGIVVVGGLALSTVLTLFVVPIVYVLMDRLCLKLTGHSSAAGLKRAKEIMQEAERIARGQESGDPAMAKYMWRTARFYFSRPRNSIRGPCARSGNPAREKTKN